MVRRSFVELVNAAAEFWVVVGCPAQFSIRSALRRCGVLEWSQVRLRPRRRRKGPPSHERCGGATRRGRSVYPVFARQWAFLPHHGVGLGVHAAEAMAARPAASMAVAAIGIRRASEVARFSLDDARVHSDAGVVDLAVRNQKNDQYGLGELPHFLEAPSWGAACPVRLLSG